MKKRTVWASIALLVIAAAIGAWLLVDDSVDPARTAVVVKKTAEAAAQAPRADPAAVPYSAAPTKAPDVNAAPHIAHKTPPPQAIAPHAPVRSMLAGLLQQARAQPPNAEAAISAYELLTQCRRLAQDPPKEPNPAAPDCTGITEADWKDAASLLKLAAELGNERAQLTYAQRLVSLGRDPDELAANRDELTAAHEKARQYLNQLAERGNVDGMWFLGESMRAGDVSAPDLTMAYAYKYAVARAGGYPYTIDAELTRLESQLSPAEQAKGRDFADRLIQRCCTKH